MIQSKSDLKYYLREDKRRNLGDIGITKYLAQSLYKTNGYLAYNYLKALRKYEYALNCKKGFVGKMEIFYRKYVWHRLCLKYDVSIGPNMVGPGFWMSHIFGGGIVINCRSMGANCGANVGVLVGNKNSVDCKPVIGDNVSLTAGCKVYGDIKIGDNVIVAPNAVVCKDVPSNCVVAGVPAKVIKVLEKK